MGHTQLSGSSSKAVRGGISPIGSPIAGSYTYPQLLQMYFFKGSFLPILYTAKYFAWG